MPLPLRVLIVEDSPNDAELMILHLTDEEFQPEWQRVQTEKDYLAALTTTPDLILADWSLPQFSGLRALQLMRERGLDIPFIIVSGSIGEEAAVEAIRQGASDYLLKDRPIRLGQAVHRALEDKQLRQERKRAEQDLKNAAAEWLTTFDAVSDGICLLDESQKVLRCNQAMVRMFGRSIDEMVGHPCWEIVHGATEPIPECPILRMQKSLQRESMDYQIGEGWFEVSVDPILDASGRYAGAVHIISDITERKRTEQAIYLMSETQRQIARLDDLTDVYQLVGQKIQELIGDGYVAVTMLDEQIQAMKVVGLYGFGSLYETLVRTFKVDPSKTVYPLKDMSDDELRLFRSGRLEAFEGGLYHLLVRKLPKRICSTVERELNLTGIYTMGFAWQDTHFGGLTLLAKCDIAPYKDMIETIMNQAVVAIKRIRSDKALRESEARYRSLIENQSEVISRSDISGRLTFANDSYCQAFGKSREELIGQVFTPTVFPEDAPVSLAALKAIQSPPHRIQTETRHLTPQGLRWFEWENSAVLDKNGKVIELQGVGRDITERKQAEEQLHQSETALKEAQQVAHIGSWAWYVQKNRLEWSDEMYRIFGIEKESFSGALTDVIAGAIHPDDRAAVEQSNLSVIKDKKPVALEYRVIRPDGTVRVVWAEAGELTLDEAGKPNILTGIVQDITERKQTEEALQKSEALFHSLVESLPQNVFSKDLQGRFTFANKQHGATEGNPLDTILGKTDFDLHPPELASKYQDDDRRVIETEQILEVVEEHQPLGRDKFYVQVIKAPLYDGKGNVAGILGIFWDITEQKQAQEAVQVSEERFRKLFELSPDAIVLIDPHAADISWPIISCNESACHMNGYLRSEIIGRSVDILHEKAESPADRDAYLERLRREGIFKGETVHRHKDGTLFPIMYSTSLITLGDRELVLGIDRDITERKQIEDKIRQQLAELQRWYDLTLDRETRSLELKHEVNELLRRLNEPPRYQSAEEDL